LVGSIWGDETLAHFLTVALGRGVPSFEPLLDTTQTNTALLELPDLCRLDAVDQWGNWLSLLGYLKIQYDKNLGVKGYCHKRIIYKRPFCPQDVPELRQ